MARIYSRKNVQCSDVYSKENELTFIEEWSDQEAIDAHMASAHFMRLVPKSNERIVSSEVQLYKKA
jgi:quinol monooxygenase YgiN